MSELVELVGDIGEWIAKANEIVHEAVTEATRTTIDEVVAVAKELAPVDTGKLRDNIKGSVSAGGHYGKVSISSKQVPYGFMVHFGTKKLAGRPFLYQAADEVGVSYPKKIQDAIGEKADANE